MTKNLDNFNWWRKDGLKLTDDLFDYVLALRQNQSYRQDENFRHMRLYGNLETYALRTYGFYRAEDSAAVLNRVTLNIVQSMVDTVVSKLTKNKPKPTFLTEGGDWDLQRKAKKLTQFVEGQFQATDFYAHRQFALQSACIFGTGPVKIFRDGDEIKCEPTFIDELTVDDVEAVTGKPRQLHQRKLIHKDVLIAAFPKSEKDIEAAAAPSSSEYGSNSQNAQTPMIEVLESWRLPSGKVKKDVKCDGKHVICIKGQKPLFEEEWRRSYFPFVFWKWNVRPMGFWGQGLSEQLMGLQLEINKILRTIQVSMHLVSVPKLLVEASSKVVSAHLNNKIGGIIKYAGTMPTFGPLGTIPAELFSHLDRLYSRAYEIAGISQLSAQSQKPSGLDSGKALREFNDIESERFMAVGQRDEDVVLQAAQIMIDEAKAIAELYGDYKVKVSSGTHVDTIDWNDVSMEEDQYVMRVFPTSALASSPAGRLQDVQDLLALGFLSKEDAMKLLDFPDLRQFYNFNNSGVENIERAIELMIDKGQYETPEPYQNLEYGIQKMQQAYLMYKTNGAPESRLELFRRWIEDANTLIQRAQQAQQAELASQQAAMQPLMPEAMPPGQIPADLVSALPPTEYAAPQDASLPAEAMLPPDAALPVQ